MKKNAYIFYSGATNETGANLAKQLKIAGGNELPTDKKSLIIGWGAKTQKDLKFGDKTWVLNHPNRIRINRNKLKALQIMKDRGINIASFVGIETIDAALKSGHVSLPLVYRPSFHQGGNGFFLCLTKTHVDKIKDSKLGSENKGYFQNYIDIIDEYRFHVFTTTPRHETSLLKDRDTKDYSIICMAKKEARDNLLSAHVKQQTDKIKKMAEKSKTEIDEKTLSFALNYQGKKIVIPDHIIRSNTRGWKFAPITLHKVHNKTSLEIMIKLQKEAVKAVCALGLDFGAVDCAIDSAGKIWIIEVNTGPGLEGSTFTKYVEAFENIIKKMVDSEAEKRKPETNNKIKDKNKNMAVERRKDNLTGVTHINSRKKKESEKLRTLADLLDTADADEAAVIRKVARRLFG